MNHEFTEEAQVQRQTPLRQNSVAWIHVHRQDSTMKQQGSGDPPRPEAGN